MKEKIIIQSSFRRIFILFMLLITYMCTSFWSEEDAINLRGFIVSILIIFTFFILLMIRYSQKIVLTKDKVIVRNRFFRWLKEDQFKYEDLIVEFDNTDYFSTYISIRCYGAPIKTPSEHIKNEYVEKAFGKFGVIITVKNKEDFF